MDDSHVFPLGVLAIIPFIGDVVGVGVSKACAGCEAGLSLCCCCHCPVKGGVYFTVVVEDQRVGLDQAPLSLSVCPAPKR